MLKPFKDEESVLAHSLQQHCKLTPPITPAGSQPPFTPSTKAARAAARKASFGTPVVKPIFDGEEVLKRKPWAVPNAPRRLADLDLEPTASTTRSTRQTRRTAAARTREQSAPDERNNGELPTILVSISSRKDRKPEFFSYFQPSLEQDSSQL